MKRREYGDYIRDMLGSVDAVREFVEGMTLEDFRGDRRTIFAVTRAIEILGEATKRIPKSVRDKYPEVPWKEMAGMRDKLIHEYFGADVDTLWHTAQEDIPQLGVLVSRLMVELTREQH
jgi:uncharacterized protein with HEPN domain